MTDTEAETSFLYDFPTHFYIKMYMNIRSILSLFSAFFFHTVDDETAIAALTTDPYKYLSYLLIQQKKITQVFIWYQLSVLEHIRRWKFKNHTTLFILKLTEKINWITHNGLTRNKSPFTNRSKYFPMQEKLQGKLDKYWITLKHLKRMEQPSQIFTYH